MEKSRGAAVGAILAEHGRLTDALMATVDLCFLVEDGGMGAQPSRRTVGGFDGYVGGVHDHPYASTSTDELIDTNFEICMSLPPVAGGQSLS